MKKSRFSGSPILVIVKQAEAGTPVLQLEKARREERYEQYLKRAILA